MHGIATNPANAVLTKEDYELYEYNRPLFRTALKGDLISKTFLFIGFSFEDPNFDYILGQIRSLLGENISTHYCFFKRVQKNEYENLTEYGYEKAKQDLREEDLKNYGIQTVFCGIL
ncbi:MAG: SIR2 family protein [Lachnospiraceae bacterium]|nr:SIR2 family protein [Lachnospiraceae bacterium]